MDQIERAVIVNRPFPSGKFPVDHGRGLLCVVRSWRCCGCGGGVLVGRDWDDDSEYRAAVRRTRVLMGIGLVVALCVVGVVALGVLGVSLFADLVEILGG
ncbi:hypothetical protein [Streptomyces gardneri]|uniref:hypothetical protein n=1 Tax=Streptomyces gardneri TaxID=66892 RepID=UPI0035E27D4F